MDDEKDNDNTTHHYSVTTDDAVENRELKSGNNSTSNHTVVADPDQLIGPQVIDMIMNKPEFSFLIRYYSLLYQSLIPNCKLTINALRQHISISDNIEQYIVGAASHRTSCQRLINFLLTHLYSEKDYMQFCYLLNIITVMTDLPYRLIAEFRTNGNFGYDVPVHPRLSLQKSKPHDFHVSKLNLMLHTPSIRNLDVNNETKTLHLNSKVYEFDACSLNDTSLECVTNDEALNNRAEKCSISTYYHCYARRGRCVVLTHATTDKLYDQGSLVVLNTSLDGYDINLLIKLTGDKRPIGMEGIQKATRTTRPSEPTRPRAKLVLKLQASEPGKQKLPDNLLTNEADPLGQLLANTNMDPNSQVLAALKKNFERLFRCLPSNCAEKVLRKFPGLPLTNESLSALRSEEPMSFNIQYTAALMLTSIKSDEDVLDFFESFEDLIDDNASKAVIEILRDEMLEILNTSATSSAPDYNTLGSNEQYTTVQQTSSTSSPTLTGSVESTASPQEATLQDLKQQLKYEEGRLQAGFTYLQPPPLPSNCINRCSLVNDIATKLLQAPNDSNIYGATLTITGPGGFGKTTTAILLCHHPDIKEHFTDGFIFIELGPQATDPSMKLRAIYKLLANEQCDINVVEQEIRQLTNHYYRNLLVIIDDVWHVEDALPLVRAFSNCKTVLTTRINNTEQYIPSKESKLIGSMNQDEAISLLTKGVIDSSKLSQQDRKVLDELAQDVHLWPLLLSLIRGQISHYVRICQFSFFEATENVKNKLSQGLTAFDKGDPDRLKESRKFRVKVCIEMTLTLLEKSISDRIKVLILYNGIGTSLQKAVLNTLWNVSKLEAQNTVDALWAYGLIQFKNVTISLNSNQQCCVEVHSVISHYIIESMEVKEAVALSPILNRLHHAVDKELEEAFKQSCGIHNVFLLTDQDFLKFEVSKLENLWLPLNLKKFNAHTVFDPFYITNSIHLAHDMLLFICNLPGTSPYVKNLFELIIPKIRSSLADYKQILNDAHKLSRKLNQSVQRSLLKQDYDELFQSVKDYIENYPLGIVLKKNIAMINKAIPYCPHDYNLPKLCKVLKDFTPEHHVMNTITFRGIKFYCKLHELCQRILLSSSDDVKKLCDYLKSGKLHRHLQLLKSGQPIQAQEDAPDFVNCLLTSL